MLDVLTDQFIQYAAKLSKEGFEFLLKLQQWAEPIHSGISRELEELKII